MKYPKAFIRTDLVVLNKTDMLKYSDFDLDFFKEKVSSLNPGVKIIELSCKTGEGIQDWIDILKERS